MQNPIPAPSSGEVVIRVHAVSLNPGSYKIMRGDFSSIAVKKPAIPELDVSGTIVSVGEGVQRWAPGDKVFGSIPAIDMIRGRQGGLREYTPLKAENM